MGETSLQYGHTAPLLDFWTGGLLAMSALAILLRLARRAASCSPAGCG